MYMFPMECTDIAQFFSEKTCYLEFFSNFLTAVYIKITYDKIEPLAENLKAPVK